MDDINPAVLYLIFVLGPIAVLVGFIALMVWLTTPRHTRFRITQFSQTGEVVLGTWDCGPQEYYVNEGTVHIRPAGQKGYTSISGTWKIEPYSTRENRQWPAPKG